MRNYALPLGLLVNFILLTFLITSCESEPAVNLDEVKIDFQFKRFEKELFDPSRNIKSKIPQFKAEYGEFFLRYCENVLQVGPPDAASFSQNLNNFINDKEILKVYELVSKEYDNMETEKNELENALKRYHYYFPNKIVPKVTTLISGFAYPIVVTDSVLGIGIDMYMGSSFSYYDMMRVPQFRKNRMNRNSLLKDAMKGWIQSEFMDESGNKTFLQQIINQGKILYAIQKTLPQERPETIMGYSIQQWDWCENHEKAMWGHFVNKKLFYSTLFTEYHKFINEGPFTAEFDRNSPDQTGYYMGWKIVNSYMTNNPEVTLSELMSNDDSKQILALSGYKPKK